MDLLFLQAVVEWGARVDTLALLAANARILLGIYREVRGLRDRVAVLEARDTPRVFRANA